MPQISIIVPVYKAERYIRRCIDSVLVQTFTDWELLLIDDGSPDRSGEICNEYAKKDKRIRVFHKKNGGVGSARNTGLDNVKGFWVVFIDSDDWCEPCYLSDFFVKKDIGNKDLVLQGKKDENHGNVIRIERLKNKSYTNIAEAILDNELLTFGAPYCKLYSYKLIEEHNIRFSEKYSYGEDTFFFLKTLSVADRIISTSKCNYHYVDSFDESLSKKDHDYKPISQFLSDSMTLVKYIDTKSKADKSLIKAYLPNYINLLLRSIANMYRLNYSYEKKQICFRDIKENMLNDMRVKRTFVYFLLRFTPIYILQFLFLLVVKIRT